MKRQTVQLKYFCTKFTSCAQNVHHRNAFVQTFAKVVNSFVSLSAASHPISAAVHFLALEWSLAVCEMPEALHSTHGSQVG